MADREKRPPQPTRTTPPTRACGHAHGRVTQPSVQGTGSGSLFENVLAPKWLEDALADASAWFSDGFDEVQVAAAAGCLFDDEPALLCAREELIRKLFLIVYAKCFH